MRLVPRVANISANNCSQPLISADMNNRMNLRCGVLVPESVNSDITLMYRNFRFLAAFTKHARLKEPITIRLGTSS
jgi:hypothetical protein